MPSLLLKDIETLKQKIKALEKENKQLKRLIYIDPLTNLYNRRALIEIGNRLIKEVRSNKYFPYKRKNKIHNFFVLFLDLDDFKKINDKYGHKKGDRVLKKLAKFLKSNFRALDTIGRWGGEEFIIYLVNINFKEARKKVENLREKIEITKMDNLNITASIGVINYTREKDILELIHKADMLMYQAKRRGKNQIVIVKK